MQNSPLYSLCLPLHVCLALTPGRTDLLVAEHVQVVLLTLGVLRAGQSQPGVEVVLLLGSGAAPVSHALAEPFLEACTALTESPLAVGVRRTAVLAVVAVVVVAVVVVVVAQAAHQDPVLDVSVVDSHGGESPAPPQGGSPQISRPHPESEFLPPELPAAVLTDAAPEVRPEGRAVAGRPVAEGVGPPQTAPVTRHPRVGEALALTALRPVLLRVTPAA